MAEFLTRNYNVAIPEVDIGDDLLIISDITATTFRRIQVKTATGKQKGKGKIAALFKVPIVQLKTSTQPDLTYIFVARFAERWLPFVVINRDELLDYVESKRGWQENNGEGQRTASAYD